MKTLMITSVLFFIIQSKENCGDYYKFRVCKDTIEYTVFSTTPYSVGDSIIIRK